MKIDQNQPGYTPNPDGLSSNGSEKSSEAFNRKITLADVASGTIRVDDLLSSNGLSKKRMLGIGAYGKVHPVQSKDGENQFVLKVKRQTVRNKSFKSELSPFLVQGKGIPVVEAYFGVVRHKEDFHLEVVYSMEEFNLKSQDFDLEAVALEFIDGKDFDKYLRDFDPSFSPIPEEKMLSLAQEVSRGASLINESGLVHRDLKPKNLMYSEKDEKVKITFIDFSTAMTIDEAKNIRHDGMDGTDGFTPPEAYESKGSPGIKDDSWALGATLTKIAFGKTPNEIYDKITGGKLGTHYEDTKGFAAWDDDKKEEVLLKEFKDDMTDRKKKYVGVIVGLTRMDPEERITTTEAYQQLSAITDADEGFEEMMSVDGDTEPESLAANLERTISNDSGIDVLGSVAEEESSVYEKKQTEKKSKSPLNMTFEERQDAASKTRNERETQYKIRADAEREWMEGFRGKSAEKKNKKVGELVTRTKRGKK